MSSITVHLKRGKERSLNRYHPWIFSGAIHRVEGDPSPGKTTTVFDSEGKFRAVGFWGNGAIRVRILSFEKQAIDLSFWQRSIARAWSLRRDLGLVANPKTNIFRLVHAEGDGLPGLIVDVYGSTAVVQAHNAGIHLHRRDIAQTLLETSKGRLEGIYYKSAETLPEGSDLSNDWLNKPKTALKPVLENGYRFEIDFEHGQKTGFFIDQRQNRSLLGEMTRGKRVLNAFCYTGGFSVYALGGGAAHVDSLDSSQKALDLCAANVAHLSDQHGSHQCIQSDALQFVKQLPEPYDVIVLDPPAFAKHVKARHRATQAYKRLNATVMRQMKPGAVLFTFSCSQVVDTQLFKDTIRAAAIECRRSVRILHQLHQPPDHPVNVFHPESEYLKGLVLRID